MTKYRRRLLMSAMAVHADTNDTQPDRSDLVTWEKLFGVIPKGVFIRKVGDEFKFFKDYGASASYLTWSDVYKIIEPGIYFTVENDEIKTNFDTSESGTPHLDAYVSVGDLRNIFPQGFSVESDGGYLYVTYNPSLITDDEDLNKFATPIDLQSIIPHGVEFFLTGGELVVRDLGLSAEGVMLSDLSEAPSLPNVYYDVNPTMYPSLRDLFQIIPSGIGLSSEGIFGYDGNLDYCDDTPMSFKQFFIIFGASYKLSWENGQVVVSEADTVGDEDIQITWGDIWERIPNGLTVKRLSSGEYYLSYSEYDKLTYSSSDVVTKRQLSKVIPYGLYLTSDGQQIQFVEALDHIIWHDRFNNPFTDNVLKSVMNGYKINVDDLSGHVTISQ